MTWLVLFVALVVGLFLARRLHKAWVARVFRSSMTDEVPSFQVEVVEATPGRTRARVVPGGTTEPMQVTALSAPHEAAKALGLEAPDGFTLERREVASATARWVASVPPTVFPGQALELEFGYDPTRSGSVAVFGHAESAKRPGSGRAGFTVLVGLRDPLEIDRANRRSALFAKARELGVPPHTLPEWEGP